MQENKNITAYRKELRGRIVETAMTAFAREGIRAVRMDDIARELGISKRTLYELYETKEDLLCEGVRKYHGQDDRQLLEMENSGMNVIEMVLAASHRKLEDFRRATPQFYADLDKYPRVLRMLESDRRRNQQRFKEFLRRGIEEGYFRNDLDYDVAVLLFDAIGQYVMSKQLYRQHDMEVVFKNMVFVSLRGICTAKGIQKLEEEL